MPMSSDGQGTEADVDCLCRSLRDNVQKEVLKSLVWSDESARSGSVGRAAKTDGICSGWQSNQSVRQDNEMK